MDNKEFWLVWNPNGSRPPSYLHRTADAPVERIELEMNELDDEIPF